MREMPAWVWVVIAVIVVAVVVALVVIGLRNRRRRSARLKERFGPEYDRTVAEVGEARAAEKELSGRERRHDKLDIRALTPAARHGYTERWQLVQATFVDDPSRALGEADQLVSQVMRERGYPVDDFDQRAADISVEHPGVVENYRAAHAVHTTQQGGDVGTEARRQAFVHYRTLFEELTRPETEDGTRSQTASADEQARAADAGHRADTSADTSGADASVASHPGRDAR